jgi:hypothetical protein
MGAFKGALQVGLRWNRQHHKIARFIRPVEPPPRFEASMSNLNHLLRQGKISADKHIGVENCQLRFRHDRSLHPCPAIQADSGRV